MERESRGPSCEDAGTRHRRRSRWWQQRCARFRGRSMVIIRGRDTGALTPASAPASPGAQLPGPFDGLIAAADLAGKARLLELMQQVPDHRPGREPQSLRQIIAPDRRPRWLRVPRERLAEQLASQL